MAMLQTKPKRQKTHHRAGHRKEWARWLWLVSGLLVFVPVSIPAQTLLDRIVAVVENKAITQQELNQNIQIMRAALAQQNITSYDEKKLVAETLQQLITKTLQLQEAQRLNIQIDEITLDRAVAAMAKNYNMDLVQLRRRVEQDGRSFEELREQIRDNLTIQQLLQREVVDKIEVGEEEIQKYLIAKSKATQQNTEYLLARWTTLIPEPGKTGLYQRTAIALKNMLVQENITSFEHLAYRNKAIWKTLWVAYFKKHKPKQDKIKLPQQTLQKLEWKKINDMSAVLKKLTLKTKLRSATPLIKEQNTLSWYYLLGIRNTEHGTLEKQYHVRHILLQTNPINGDAVIQQRLQKIKGLIQKHNNFEELAKRYSKDPGSSFKGGDLGWSNLKSFVPEFRQAALQSAQTHQMVGPVKTSFGWHLVEVMDVREDDLGDKMARNEAIAQIRRSKLEEARTLWLINLRENRHIEIFL